MSELTLSQIERLDKLKKDALRAEAPTPHIEKQPTGQVKRIKDLDPKRGLGGVRFRFPGDGQLYYWYSQWQKGVWGKKDPNGEQVFPLDCDDLKDTLEWEVVQ